MQWQARADGTGCHAPPTRLTWRADMIHNTTARDRVEQADSLAALLDAAHDAFEDMLSVIRVHEDPEDGMFIPLVMVAASVADGRDAIAFAPSLPPRRLHPATAGKQPLEPG